MRRCFPLLLPLLVGVTLAGFPALAPAQAGAKILPGFPVLRQLHPLTCESAAASMATRGRVTEGQIMALLPRNGNPNLGFRGNPDGQQGMALVDYGVYAAPIQKALQTLGYVSEVRMYGYPNMIRSYIERGWPVVTWISYNLKPSKPRLAWKDGSQFFLVPYEHAVMVVGYDATNVFAYDPWGAVKVRYDWKKFTRSWGYFGNMALAVQPCPVPQAVADLRLVSASATKLAWSWRRSAGAATYHVRVVQQAQVDKVVFDGVQTDQVFALAPQSPGAYYEISVVAVGSCGATSSPERLVVKAPRPAPTAAATPVPETVLPTPTSATGTPRPVSTRTSTAVAVSPVSTASATATSQKR